MELTELQALTRSLFDELYPNGKWLSMPAAQRNEWYAGVDRLLARQYAHPAEAAGAQRDDDLLEYRARQQFDECYYALSAIAGFPRDRAYCAMLEFLKKRPASAPATVGQPVKCCECGSPVSHPLCARCLTVEHPTPAVRPVAEPGGERKYDGAEIVKRLVGAYVIAGLGDVPDDWQKIIDRFVAAVQAQEHVSKLATERYDRILELEREAMSPVLLPQASGGDEDIYANSFHVWNDPKGATSWAELGEHLQGRWRTAIGTVLAVARERVLAEVPMPSDEDMRDAYNAAMQSPKMLGNFSGGWQCAVEWFAARLARLSQPVAVEPVDRVTIVQKGHVWEVYCDGVYEMGGLSKKNANRLAGSIRAELDAMKKEAKP